MIAAVERRRGLFSAAPPPVDSLGRDLEKNLQ